MSEYNSDFANNPTVLDSRPGVPPTSQNYNSPSQGFPQEDVPADATFILSPKTKPSFAWLIIIKGTRRGQLFTLKEQGSKIGRSGRCEIALSQDRAISSEHAKVYKDGDDFVIHDLASSNGTFVNGQKVYHQTLKENDAVKIGETTFIFKQIRGADLNG